jgi:hypothetical protein
MNLKMVLAPALAVALSTTAFTGKALAAPDQGLGMTIMSAEVSSGGTLLAGAGVVGVSEMGIGQYFVAFNRSVLGCTVVGSPSAIALPGFIIARGSPGTIDGTTYFGLRVDTLNKNTTSESLSFNLIVFCAR